MGGNRRHTAIVITLIHRASGIPPLLFVSVWRFMRICYMHALPVSGSRDLFGFIADEAVSLIPTAAKKTD
jgi:hypothetical protein